MASLFPEQALHPGQIMQSDNKLHTLKMLSDGHVVLYNQQSQPIWWAPNTAGSITPGRFIMQTDGNLVLYDSGGNPLWASKTCNNPGAFFRVQNDGNLVVYRAGTPTESAEYALWASRSQDIRGHAAPAGDHMVQELLNAHNSYRSQVGRPPLTWSDTLASDAQKRAHYLASNGLFFHDERELNEKAEGENLWEGSPPHAFTFTQMVSSWGDERQHFVNRPIPHVSNTGKFEDVGHYTQLVWRNTTHVGCGFAVANGRAVLVCRYSPRGNVTGESVF